MGAIQFKREKTVMTVSILNVYVDLLSFQFIPHLKMYGTEKPEGMTIVLSAFRKQPAPDYLFTRCLDQNIDSQRVWDW